MQRDARSNFESGFGQVDPCGYETIDLHRDGRELPGEIVFTDMLADGRRLFAVSSASLRCANTPSRQ